MIPEEEGPDIELPEEGRHVWEAFQDLHAARTYGSAISYRDISDYSSMRGPTLVSWEVEALRKIDAAWLSQIAEDQHD